MIIGLNHSTAPEGVRDRFWIPQDRIYPALVQLRDSEGIQEVVTISTRNRTEFVLWATDVTAASNSTLAFLSREYGLRLSEWQKFYCKLDECAAVHLFRLAAGLDCRISGDSQISGHLARAWRLAQAVGSSGAMLDALFNRALAVGQQMRVAPEKGGLTAEQVIVEAARQLIASFGCHEASSAKALRQRLEALARSEIEQVRLQAGPLVLDQERWMEALATRIVERVSSTILRELKPAPGKRNAVTPMEPQTVQ